MWQNFGKCDRIRNSKPSSETITESKIPYRNPKLGSKYEILSETFLYKTVFSWESNPNKWSFIIGWVIYFEVTCTVYDIQFKFFLVNNCKISFRKTLLFINIYFRQNFTLCILLLNKFSYRRNKNTDDVKILKIQYSIYCTVHVLILLKF